MGLLAIGPTSMNRAGKTLRASNKTAGDCPNFAQSAEQNGTVPFSEAVLLDALISHLR